MVARSEKQMNHVSEGGTYSGRIQISYSRELQKCRMDTSILEAAWSYRQSLAGAERSKGVPAFYICGKLRKEHWSHCCLPTVTLVSALALTGAKLEA